MFNQERWNAYQSDHISSVVKPHGTLVPRYQYERDFIRLVRKVVDWCRWVEAGESRVWPQNADGSTPGNPWDQPVWRMKLMESFWSGREEMREVRKKKTG